MNDDAWLRDACGRPMACWIPDLRAAGDGPKLPCGSHIFPPLPPTKKFKKADFKVAIRAHFVGKNGQRFLPSERLASFVEKKG